MSVLFEFTVEKGFHFSTVFASHFNIPVAGDRVYLPEALGDGFIQEVRVAGGLSLCIHRYTLRQEFILRRLSTGSSEPLTIKFDGSRIEEREVEFGSGNFFTELVVPPHQAIVLLIIGTSREDLLRLLDIGQEGRWIEDTIRHISSFVLYERMTMEMERVLYQIGQIDSSTRLATLLYQTRAQELIYLLFARFLSRGDSPSVNVNPEDVAKIYEVRATVIRDLSQSPSLPALATGAGMSLTKMKQLFQQVFGKSIYNYYQAARMEQAAELLRHLSVSETGYMIGFVNMSHFSRLFEKHHLVKPKRYKDTLKMG